MIKRLLLTLVADRLVGRKRYGKKAWKRSAYERGYHDGRHFRPGHPFDLHPSAGYGQGAGYGYGRTQSGGVKGLLMRLAYDAISRRR